MQQFSYLYFALVLWRQRPSRLSISFWQARPYKITVKLLIRHYTVFLLLGVRPKSTSSKMPINGSECYEPIRKMKAVQVKLNFF